MTNRMLALLMTGYSETETAEPAAETASKAYNHERRKCHEETRKNYF